MTPYPPWLTTYKNAFLKFYFSGKLYMHSGFWTHDLTLYLLQEEEDLVELESIEISCKNAMMPLFMKKGKFH